MQEPKEPWDDAAVSLLWDDAIDLKDDLASLVEEIAEHPKAGIRLGVAAWLKHWYARVAATLPPMLDDDDEDDGIPWSQFRRRQGFGFGNGIAEMDFSASSRLLRRTTRK